MTHRHKTLVPFLSGVFAILMLMSMILTAGATDTIYKNITIRPGIKLFIDDVQLIPRDVTGAEVDVFIYNGTTYVPARALSEALGKVIQYEGKTNGVYIGKHTGESPAVMLADLDYFAGTESIKMVDSDQDNFGNVHTNCFLGASWNRKYLLDAQYTRMTGTLYQSYDRRSYPITQEVVFEVFGDGKLLYAKHFSDDVSGYYPEPFSVDLTGVLELEVKHKCNAVNAYDVYVHDVAIGDCGLWT